MFAHESLATNWQARLRLGFELRNDASILSCREHFGPLRIQKPLYPEGPAVCHAILLHPPAGIAGGDELKITANIGTGAHALLTTPGAGKWYRSAGPWASQQINFSLGKQALLEWLPQETIIYDGARAGMGMHVDLEADASFIGWEVLCLGRRASGEQFGAGALSLSTRISRQGQPLWIERGLLESGSPLLQSPAGLAGYSVSGTLLAAADGVEPALLQACRGIVPRETGVQTGVTALPGLLVARYLGHSSEAARAWFFGLWGELRPKLLGRAARAPRIWNT